MDRHPSTTGPVLSADSATFLQPIGADDIPQVTAICSRAVGALVGLLAAQPRRIIRDKD